MEKSTQAVILAAGKGTRMQELTTSMPKPMLEVGGMPLLAHKIMSLPDHVTEVVLVVGYHEHVIRGYFGESWKGKTICYVYQEILNGTGGALLAARDVLAERFIVMMGDDLYAASDLALATEQEWAIFVSPRANTIMGGEILRDEAGHLIGIDEPRHHVESGFINIGLYALRKELIDRPLVPVEGKLGEYGLPQMLAAASEHELVKVIPVTSWMQVTAPEDLPKAEEFLAHTGK